MTRATNIPEAEKGLYDPATEHAACGVGFIASLKGLRSHDIVRQALQIAMNLEHRGACGCDPQTGDGSGILIQTPHEFLQNVAGDAGIRLPDLHEYGIGQVFLPSDARHRRVLEQMFEATVGEEGQDFLGWREVPRNSEVAGRVARATEPVIKQIFIGRGKGVKDNDSFERKLYVIRKVMERRVRMDPTDSNPRASEAGMGGAEYFHVASLSQHTLVYKGLLLATQIESYFTDLADPTMKSGLALVHQRYSTNTFPTWDLAQPFRFLCHNGEINTLRGNVNWMHAREKLFKSPLFGEDMGKIVPVLTPGASDSAILDNAIELLYHTGRSLPHCIAMLIPEAWESHQTMSEAKKAFYEYHSCMMEPWDGPASIAFTNGKIIGAVLDRNGLRPSRYTVTKDGYVIMASETGVLDVDPANVLCKGRLQPGRMFLVDTDGGRIVPDDEIKEGLAARKPYRVWLDRHLVRLADLSKGVARDTAKPVARDSAQPVARDTAQPVARDSAKPYDFETLLTRQKAFGYTLEDLRLILGPMANNAAEPLGSMGSDTPLAVLSDHAPLLYDYFKQLFAQVTNPPLDAIREELVTSTATDIGPEADLFEETERHCHQLRIEHFILDNRDLAKIRNHDNGVLRCKTLPMLFPVSHATPLSQALEELCESAAAAVLEGYSILVLSDRGVNAEYAGIPALLAVAAVHHRLIRECTRTRCGLILESGEPREVHHFAMLLAYGVGAVNPYVALETLADMHRKGQLDRKPRAGAWGSDKGLTLEQVERNYAEAVNKGVVKVISKMGISTLDGYRGAQIVEAVGLNAEVIDQYFTGTPSRIGGVGLDVLAAEVQARHARGYPKGVARDTAKPHAPARDCGLDVGGRYQWRRRGEYHLNNPETLVKLAEAVRRNCPKTFAEFSELTNRRTKQLATLRGLLEFKPADQPLRIEEVEPAEEIVKRFKTGAMSFGSISFEAHANLAIAMNRIGGKSNTGEGGEDPIRFKPFLNGTGGQGVARDTAKLRVARDTAKRRQELAELSPWAAEILQDGDSMRSAIKQVASGRFGVTSEYLVNADELQIKMAQGAKPGEGGQLPGYKVDEWIGRTRHSTPGVGLISPPPHHDIYSIEDLAQLIHDLKNANRRARINVKLVAEVGVGTVAAGVSKGKADVVLISGHDGGTGASPLSSIKHAGLPWELGLAETHQVLVMNDLRSRIVVEVDGQLRTGRDVAIACLLGAEEFGFATAPLIASGCVMMRKCHLNTCPVGIATQDPELRKKFAGKPEHVINFMFFVAQELREIMASLGFRTIPEMVGRVDKLEFSGVARDTQDTHSIPWVHWKARTLDFSKILHYPVSSAGVSHATPLSLSRPTPLQKHPQDHGIDRSLDVTTLLNLAAPAIERGQRVYQELPIRNTNRTVGTITGSEVTLARARIPSCTGEDPVGPIHFKFFGSAGQSFAAFVPRGMTMEIEGDANDYYGKGLSGGKLIIYPPKASTFVAEENIIIGNVAFYGATSGEAYVRGIAGERFCIRNSGLRAVVEGVGDHGCEYMTGGRVVVLGSTGRNFAAGMSGGIAYVLDKPEAHGFESVGSIPTPAQGDFGRFRCNRKMVELEEVVDPQEASALRGMIEAHVGYTDSAVGRRVLECWDMYLPRFVKVMPIDYKRVLQQRAVASTLCEGGEIPHPGQPRASVASPAPGRGGGRRVEVSDG